MMHISGVDKLTPVEPFHGPRSANRVRISFKETAGSSFVRLGSLKRPQRKSGSAYQALLSQQPVARVVKS